MLVTDVSADPAFAPELATSQPPPPRGPRLGGDEGGDLGGALCQLMCMQEALLETSMEQHAGDRRERQSGLSGYYGLGKTLNPKT